MTGLLELVTAHLFVVTLAVLHVLGVIDIDEIHSPL